MRRIFRDDFTDTCLLALVSLADTQEAVTAQNTARLNGISKPSAHRTIGLLQEMGMIDKKRYGSMFITEKGRETAARLGCYRDSIALHFSSEYCLSLADASAAAILLLGELSEESLENMLRRITV